jgi:chaperonin GroES
VKVRPLHDRILVQRLDGEAKTAGGIIIPDSAKEKPQRGEVIAAGDGKVLSNGERAALEVKEGDTILFAKWGGSEVKVEGETYLILREDEILGVVTG